MKVSFLKQILQFNNLVIILKVMLIMSVENNCYLMLRFASIMAMELLLTLLMIKHMSPVTIVRRKITNLNRKRCMMIRKEMIEKQISTL